MSFWELVEDPEWLFSLSLKGVDESDGDLDDIPDLVDSSDSDKDASAEKEDVTASSDESGIFHTFNLLTILN